MSFEVSIIFFRLAYLKKAVMFTSKKRIFFKSLIILFKLIVLFSYNVFAQKSVQTSIDSMKMKLARTTQDTDKVNLLIFIAESYDGFDYKKGIDYSNEALKLAQQVKYLSGESDAYNVLGVLNCNYGYIKEAFEYHTKALLIRKKIGDESRLGDTYCNIGNIYYFQSNFDSAIYYQKASLVLRDKLNDKKGVADNYNNIGAIYGLLGNGKEEIINYLESLQIRIKVNDREGIATSYNNLGGINDNIGNFPEALKYFYKSLRIWNALGKEQDIIQTEYNIANSWNKLKKKDSAHVYFKRVLNKSEALNDRRTSAACYLSLAGLYSDWDKDIEALDNYQKALSLDSIIGDNQGIAMVYTSLGTHYDKKEQFSKALSFYNDALRISSAIPDSENICINYMNIGAVYTAQGLYKKALAITEDGMGIAIRNSYNESTIQFYENLSKIDSALGNYKEALRYYQKYKLLEDSIFNYENSVTINQAQGQYEFEKKELLTNAAHEKQLALTNAANKLRQRLITSISIGLLTITFVVFYYYRKQEGDRFRIQLAQLKQEALNAQMNDHFIFNTISSINNFIKTNDKQKASDYLLRFRSLIRQVLINSQSATVPIMDDIQVLRDFVEIEKLRFDGILELKTEIDKEIDALETLIPPMVFQTLVENSIKHAFVGKKNGLIKVSVNKQNQFLNCTVEDNGIGRTPLSTFEKSDKSFGLELAVELVRTAHKSFKNVNFEIVDLNRENNSTSGTRVSFVLPIVNND